MNHLRRVASTLLALTAAVAIDAPAEAQPNPSARLLGSWDIVYTYGDGSQLAAVVNFQGGATANDGSLTLSTGIDTTPPVPCGPAIGAWKRQGARRFLTTFRQYCPNDGSDPEETGNLLLVGYDEITVNGKGDELAGTETLVGYDYEGNLLFSDSIAFEGHRIVAGPAPDDLAAPGSAGDPRRRR